MITLTAQLNESSFVQVEPATVTLNYNVSSSYARLSILRLLVPKLLEELVSAERSDAVLEERGEE